MSAIIPRSAVTRSAEIALFVVVSLLPLAVSAAAVMCIAYVHDGVVVSGWMPQDRREGYTELSTWVWILTPWLAVALTLLVAIWSRRFSNGSAILISIVLFAEWMYIFRNLLRAAGLDVRGGYALRPIRTPQFLFW